MVVDLEICDSKSVLIVDWQFYTFLESAWDSNIPRTMGFPPKKCEVMLYKLKLHTSIYIYTVYLSIISVISELYIQVILFCCWVQKVHETAASYLLNVAHGLRTSLSRTPYVGRRVTDVLGRPRGNRCPPWTSHGWSNMVCGTDWCARHVCRYAAYEMMHIIRLLVTFMHRIS